MSDVSYMNRRKRFTLIGTLTLVIGFWVGWGVTASPGPIHYISLPGYYRGSGTSGD